MKYGSLNLIEVSEQLSFIYARYVLLEDALLLSGAREFSLDATRSVMRIVFVQFEDISDTKSWNCPLYSHEKNGDTVIIGLEIQQEKGIITIHASLEVEYKNPSDDIYRNDIDKSEHKECRNFQSLLN